MLYPPIIKTNDLGLGYPKRNLLITEADVLYRFHDRTLTPLYSEKSFVSAFFCLAQQNPDHDQKNQRVVKSASEALEVVTKVLEQSKKSIAISNEALQEVFYDTFKSKNIETQLLDDPQKRECYVGRVRDVGITADALLLVSPDNPTGQFLTRSAFVETARHCAEQGKILIIDNCFRFNIPADERYDQFEILRSSGVSYFMIDDTGKNFPAEGHKASILSFSPDLQEAVDATIQPASGASGHAVSLLTHWIIECGSMTLNHNHRLRRTNQAMLEDAVRDHPNFARTVNHPTSSFCYMELERPLEDHVADKLSESHVVVRRKRAFRTTTLNFEDAWPGHIRISLIRNPEDIEQAARVIKRSLEDAPRRVKQYREQFTRRLS